MKAKINGIYLRMLPNKMRFVRVLDFVTMESGERGVVFVNKEATDEQIQITQFVLTCFLRVSSSKRTLLSS